MGINLYIIFTYMYIGSHLFKKYDVYWEFEYIWILYIFFYKICLNKTLEVLLALYDVYAISLQYYIIYIKIIIKLYHVKIFYSVSNLSYVKLKITSFAMIMSLLNTTINNK